MLTNSTGMQSGGSVHDPRDLLRKAIGMRLIIGSRRPFDLPQNVMM